MSDEPPVNEASKLQNSQTKNSGEEGSIQMVPINRDDAQDEQYDSGHNAAGNAQDSGSRSMPNDQVEVEEDDGPNKAKSEGAEQAKSGSIFGDLANLKESEKEREAKMIRETCGVFYYHMKEKEGTDESGPKIFSKRSLFCLSDQNKCRQAFAWLALWPQFDNFITVMILLNSIMLATTSYEVRLDPDYKSDWTPIQEKIDIGFSIIFICEFIVKVIAMGFVLHRKSYLWEPWNCLDFFIVCVSVVGFLPMGSGSSGLKALRTFRILRPLRSVNKMPTIKKQIQSLLASIPGLMRVFFFIIFIFCIFAIFGTNQFLGQQYQFCRSQLDGEYDEAGEFLRWPKSGEDDGNLHLCATDDQCRGYYPDDEVSICGTVYDQFGLDPMIYDDIRNIELIMYGIPSFDNVFWGFLTIFQILTLESWVYLMYNFSDTGNPVISVIFFVLAVLLGAFFTMNLVLAIIVDAFDANDSSNEEEEAERQQKQMEKERMRLSASVLQSPSPAKPQREPEEKEVSIIRQQEFSEAESKIDNIQVKKSSDKDQGLLPSLTNKSGVAEAAKGFETAEQKVDQNIQQEIQNLPSQGAEQELYGTRTFEKLGAESSNFESTQKIVPAERVVQISDIKPTSAQIQPVVDDNSGEYAMHDLFDELDYERDARNRSRSGSCYRCLYNIVTSVSFNFFIFVLIIANTFTLAVYTYDQSETQTEVLVVFNELFTWSFFLEMIMKIIGLGFVNYRQDKYNVFDAVIVVISLVDWTITRIPNLDAGSALNAFRALRLLRMLKLSKSWKALADILRKAAKSMQEILSFSLLLFLFMYIFALLGMELFANTALVDENGDLVIVKEEIEALYASDDYYTFPRANFNNVGYALTTIFIIIIGEDWNWSMYEWVRIYGNGSSSGEILAILFFLLLMIMGNVVLFSLFTAVLLRNFEGGDEEEEEEEEEGGEDELKNGISQRIKTCQFWKELFEDFQEAFGKKKKKNSILNSQGEPVFEQLEEKLGQEPDRQGLHDDKSLSVSALELSEHDEQLDEAPQKSSDRQQAGNDFKRKAKYRSDRKVGSLMHYNLMQTFIEQSTVKVKVEVDEEDRPPMTGVSLCCLSTKNTLRNLVYRFAYNWWFTNIILLLIIISTITLAFETPLDDPESQKIKILKHIDFGMTLAFTFEASVKIIALGFAFSGKGSYIRNPWNILDFIIVASALMGVIAGDASKLSFIKALRILKILRPLRLIAKDKNLKIAIISLSRSIPNIVRLQVIVLFFVFLFAILQTTILSGEFYYCETEHLSLSMKQQKKYIMTMYDCYNYGGEWVKPELNFDTTLVSMLTLLTIQTTEGWIDVLWNSVDAAGPYMQPQEGNSPFMIVYTMVLVIIICMLFMELFVGIVIETFNNQKELIAGNRDLLRTQRSFIEVQMMTIAAKPKKRLEAEFSKLRNLMINLSESKNFDLFIMICILANTFVLAFNWYMQPKSYKDVLEIFNYTFMAIFTIEAIIKIIAQRLDYFKDSWNIFDFVVVAGTIVILGITWAGLAKGLEILGTILRTLRIGRVFRLIKKQQKLQEIFKTLLDAAPAMASLGLLLMLLIFMFAIIGMSQFALVKIQDGGEMRDLVNFQTFGAAFLTLIRCATGEAWNAVMFETSMPRSILNQCVEDEDFDKIIADGRDPTSWSGPQGCGSGVAIGFHLLFQIIVSQVFLNLFIAIIIDAFFGQTDLANMPVQQKTIEDFQRIWSKYDKDGTGFISVSNLDNLMIDMANAHKDEAGSLIAFKQRTLIESFRRRQIAYLEIPTYKGMTQVMFYDVLMRLCFQAMAQYYEKMDVKRLQSQIKLLKTLGKGAVSQDSVDIVAKQTMKKDRFVRDFKALQIKMQDPNPRAELISELKVENRRLSKKFNHLVDTDKKMCEAGQSQDQQLRESVEVQDVNLYTTKHLGATREIYDFISEYLKKKEGQREGGQIIKNEVGQSRNIHDNDMNSNQRTASQKDFGGEKANIQASVNVIDYNSNMSQRPMIEKQNQEVADVEPHDD